MKCNRCRGPAVIEVRRHNAAYCKDCFIHVFREQVKRAIRQHDMFADRRSDPGRRLGRQGFARALGRPARPRVRRRPGSTWAWASAATRIARASVTKDFADERGSELIVVDLERDYGYDIPTAGSKGSRSTCAVCGLSKRYVFNRAAMEGGFDVDRDRAQPGR